MLQLHAPSPAGQRAEPMGPDPIGMVEGIEEEELLAEALLLLIGTGREEALEHRSGGLGGSGEKHKPVFLERERGPGAVVPREREAGDPLRSARLVVHDGSTSEDPCRPERGFSGRRRGRVRIIQKTPRSVNPGGQTREPPRRRPCP